MLVRDLLSLLADVDPTAEVEVPPLPGLSAPVVGYFYADRSTISHPVVVLTGDVYAAEFRPEPSSAPVAAQSCDQAFDYYAHIPDDPCSDCGEEMGDHPSARP